MRKHLALTCICSCLGALATGISAASDSDHSKKDAGELFSVPFFIENINATAPNALRADFTLKHPAIMESFFIYCAGAPRGGLLLMDTGPAGLHGTTGVGADPQVGFVIGEPANLEIPLQIDFTVTAGGAYIFAPTHLGVPIKSSYSFIVFPNAPNSVQCQGNFVFRSLD